MNRRELLKFSLLSPLLGLFKKKEPRWGITGMSDEEIIESFLCWKESQSFETTGTLSNCKFIIFDEPYTIEDGVPAETLGVGNEEELI